MSGDPSNPPAEPAEPVFLVTTENALGRASRRVVFGMLTAFGLLIGVGGNLAAYDAERTLARGEMQSRGTSNTMRPVQARIVWSAGGLACLGFAFVTLRFGWPRGAWILDGRGIAFQPLRGGPRKLEWT